MSAYITEKERYYIEFALEHGISKKEIALKLGKCLKTIYNEINLGTVELVDTHLRPYKIYKADYAQRKHELNQETKGRSLNIGSNTVLSDFLENKILKEKYSPYAALQLAASSGLNPNFCLSTLYSYIRKRVFLNLKSKHLPNKGRKHKAEKPSSYSVKLIGTKNFIDDRSKTVLKRNDFGHWEFDTVYSSKGDKHTLFVLTERKTRLELIFKMYGRTASNSVSVLDYIENLIGSDSFRHNFKTITCDNGVEFSNINRIKHSQSGHERTKLYFCHAYSSCERGSNENANKLIRRFIPKKSFIRDFKQPVSVIQKWINTLPRRLFCGKSSIDMLREEGSSVYNSMLPLLI